MDKSLSTFYRMMQDKEFKEKFDKGYEEFLISEQICEAMNEMKISVMNKTPVNGPL